MKGRRKQIGRVEAVAFLLLALLMGTVFTAGMGRWNQTVERAQCKRTEGVYQSYKVLSGKGSHSTRGIELYFDDREKLTIDGCCVSDRLAQALDALPRGTQLEMQLHPHSDSVMEIRTGEKMVLPFDEAQRRLAEESKGFFGLGMFCYACSVYMGVRLIIDWKKGWIRIRRWGETTENGKDERA